MPYYLTRAHRYSALGDNYFIAVEILTDGGGHLTDVFEVSSTVWGRGSAYCNEYHQGLPDCTSGIGCEMQAAFFDIFGDELGEPRLIKRHFSLLQELDPGLILVYTADADAKLSKTGTGNQPHIANTNNTDMH